jgi:predicted transcriptional regulator
LIRVEDDILNQLHGLAEDLDRMKEATIEPSPEPDELTVSDA